MSIKKCKNKKKLPFDNGIIKIYNKDILIEYDGKPHFFPIKFFGGINNYRKRVKNDIIKNKFALENNKILLRISYKEINEIEKWIRIAIEEAQNNKKSVIIYSNPSLYKTCYIPKRYFAILKLQNFFKQNMNKIKKRKTRSDKGIKKKKNR